MTNTTDDTIKDVDVSETSNKNENPAQSLAELQLQAQEHDGEKFQQATNVYRSASESNMSGFDVVVELYKGMIRNVENAKSAYKQGKLDEMCELIEKTNKILIALQSHLNFEDGGEAAQTLNTFYNGIFGSLAQILRTKTPEEDFDKVLKHLHKVYEIWCKHAENERKQAP